MQTSLDSSIVLVAAIIVTALTVGFTVFLVVACKLKTDLKQLLDGSFLQILTVVLAAVIAGMLTLADKLPAEGAISILSGIVGYVLGSTGKIKRGEG